MVNDSKVDKQVQSIMDLLAKGGELEIRQARTLFVSLINGRADKQSMIDNPAIRDPQRTLEFYQAAVKVFDEAIDEVRVFAKRRGITL